MTEGTPSTPVSALKANTANTPVAANSPLRSKDVLLPLARVRTIMKSSPDVENIGQESLFLITKVSIYDKANNNENLAQFFSNISTKLRYETFEMFCYFFYFLTLISPTTYSNHA